MVGKREDGDKADPRGGSHAGDGPTGDHAPIDLLGPIEHAVESEVGLHALPSPPSQLAP
jgi:hypothetical protein